MSEKIFYDDDAPFGKVTRMVDFLPPPSELVKREERVKITLEVTKSSLDFFKEQAELENIPYQRLLRGLIDHYVKGQHS